MNRTLTKVGNSVAVTIPPELLERYGLKLGDEVTLEQTERGITVAPARTPIDPAVEAAMRAVFTEHREAFRLLAAHDRQE